MKSTLYNIFSKIKIAKLKLSGDSLNKVMIDIVENYYYLQSEGRLHEECIRSIIDSNYEEKDMMNDCSYFVFSKKGAIDKAFDIRYGKSGYMLAHLYKLIQKVYIDFHLKEKKRSYEEELSYLDNKMKKNFNFLVLHFHEKYSS